MNPTKISSARRAFRAFCVAALFATATVFAGPPLICHPYAIGAAKSLPGGDDAFYGTSASYDRKNLIADTQAFLTPDARVIVRMETLRRAALYATANMRKWSGKGDYTPEDRALAHGLLARLRERADQATGAARPLALFDAGFFAETLRQTGLDPEFDGFPLLVQARELRGTDAEMDFALAVASVSPQRKEHSDHLARARAAAKANPLLAANLATHFGRS